MSEFVYDNENETNLVSCNSAEVPISINDGKMNKEKQHDATDYVENDASIDEHFNSRNVSEYFSDVSEIEELDGVAENAKKRNLYSFCVNNSKLRQAISTSTLEMHKDVAVYSRHVSDKMPLLKGESSVTCCCSDRNTEGENETSETSCECSYLGDKDSDQSSLNDVSITSQTRESLMMPGSIRAPIVGHETVEARTRFTMFKIHVSVEVDDAGWFIFRRYSDFVHLNDQLKVLFPNFRLSLPPKRWFRSNFDSDFLEERLLGLQAFVDNVTGHRDICNSQPVRDFFCFDDPPGPHDSLEESRAQCDSMEETLYMLRSELSDRDTEIQLLKEELDLYKKQVELLSRQLRQLNRRSSFEKSGSEKHRSPSSVGQIGIDALLDSGNQLLTNKLETVNKSKRQELKRNEQLSDTNT